VGASCRPIILMPSAFTLSLGEASSQATVWAATPILWLLSAIRCGLILSAFGTGAGLVVAYWCRHALVMLLPTRSGVSMYLPGQMDARVLVMSAAVCLLVTFVVGMVPAFQTRHLDLVGPLKADSSSVVGAREKAWMRSILVVFQVGLSFLLLVGAVLLLESLQRIRNTSPGFATTSVVTTGVSLVAAGYDVPRAKAFQDELIDRLHALPEVESAAFAGVTPLSYTTYASTPIAVDGYQPSLEEQPEVEYNQVGPGYFVTIGIPVLFGREFARSDNENAPLVAIVNRTMVTRNWGGQNPVGLRLQVKGRWVRVVGVVADSKYASMRESPRPFFYAPLRQDFVKGAALNIRTRQAPSSIRAVLVREVHALDENLALYEMITLQEQVNRSTSPQFVAVTLVSILGGLALLLAAVGVYGVMSYTVARGTRELGIRMALGASTTTVLRLVISRGLRLAAEGVLFGTVAALAVTRLLGRLLFNVSPYDPAVFGLALGVTTTTAIFACLLPAWQASQTDPARVLRN
jgi:predicted permease